MVFGGQDDVGAHLAVSAEPFHEALLVAPVSSWGSACVVGARGLSFDWKFTASDLNDLLARIDQHEQGRKAPGRLTPTNFRQRPLTEIAGDRSATGTQQVMYQS